MARDREQGGPPPGPAEEGSKRGGAWLRGIPATPPAGDGGCRCPPAAPVPRQGPRAQPCHRLPAPHCLALLPGPPSSWAWREGASTWGQQVPGTPCLPLHPTHSQSSLPTSQQSQQLSNRAVWLQALILHRARPEAPTQHSCPHWRLPANGPASCPATHCPGAEARGPTLPGLAQAKTPRQAWTETRGGALAFYTSASLLCQERRRELVHTSTQHGSGHTKPP